MGKLKKSIIKYSDIEKYEIDDSANEYPMLSKAQHETLVEDIRENGQRQPVIIYKRKIMDGRNRVKAVTELKKHLSAIILDSYEDALQLAISNNDKRRHMSKSQFAMRAAYRLLESRVDDNQEPLPKTEWLAVEDSQEIVDKIVSKRTVESALTLAKKDEHLAKDVFDGHIELGNAMRKIQEQEEMIAYDDPQEFDGNISATRIYKGYMAKGAFTKKELAKRLAMLEVEIQEKRLKS